MKAEEAEVVDTGFPAGCGEEGTEAPADILGFAGKPGETDPTVRELDLDGSGVIENVQVGVGGEEGEGQHRSFMVAGNEHHRDPGVGHLEQRFEAETDELGRDLGSEEEIAAVDDEVDLATHGGGQGGAGIGEEVGAAAAAFDAGPQREVEAEVGVGQEEDAETQGAAVVVSRRWRS